MKYVGDKKCCLFLLAREEHVTCNKRTFFHLGSVYR